MTSSTPELQSVKLATSHVSNVDDDSRKLGHVWLAVLFCIAVAFASNLIVLFSGINRGLDVDVESFYLLQYQHPEIYPAFSSFHLILSKLPKLAANEIVSYRLMEVVARLLPAFLLASGFSLWANRWMRFSKLQFGLLITFAMLGASEVFCCFPRTISYNGLSAGLLTTSAACTFFALYASTKNGNSILRNVLFFCAGLFVEISAFVKVTSAAALLPAIFLLMFFNKSKLSDYAATIAGAFGGLLTFFGVVQSPLDWWQAFSEAIKFELTTDHSPKSMVFGTLGILKKHWWHGLLAGSAIAFLWTSMVRAKENVQNRIAQSSLVGFSLLLGVWTYVIYDDPAVMYNRESIAVLSTLVFLAVFVSVRSRLNLQLSSGIALMTLFPAIAALGTNCNFLPHAMSNAAPWFIVVMLASFACARRFQLPNAVSLVPLALAILSSVQFFEQYVYIRDDGLSLPDQNTSTDKVQSLVGMKLKKSDIDFYENAQKILSDNGFQRGDYMLTMYDFPSLAYVMNARSPGQSWYISWPERDEINAYYFRKADVKKDDRFFLVLAGEDPKKIVCPAMEDELMGTKLNRAFKRIGVLPHPRKDEYKVFFYASRPKTKI